VNNLLLTIHRDNSLMGIPKPDHWNLEDEGKDFIALCKWNPRLAHHNVYKVVALPTMSDPGALTPLYPRWATLEGVLLPSRVKSIELPSQEVFEIRGSHVLLSIHCRVKVKINKKESRMEESRYSMIIPVDLKVVDLVKGFKVTGNVSGVFVISDSMNNVNIKRKDVRTAADLGWRNGTEVRLDML
jgi:hypothetical protein